MCGKSGGGRIRHGPRGRSVQRSFTVRVDSVFAEQRQREVVEDHGVTRVDFSAAGARFTLGELLARFFDAPHLWKPATVVSHRPVVRALLADRWPPGAWWC